MDHIASSYAYDAIESQTGLMYRRGPTPTKQLQRRTEAFIRGRTMSFKRKLSVKSVLGLLVVSVTLVVLLVYRREPLNEDRRVLQQALKQDISAKRQSSVTRQSQYDKAEFRQMRAFNLESTIDDNDAAYKRLDCFATKTDLTFDDRRYYQNPQVCLRKTNATERMYTAIKTEGVWQRNMGILLRNLIGEFDANNDPVTFIDIDAHIGFHAMHIAMTGVEVLATETQVQFIRALHQSVQMNAFTDRFRLFPYNVRFPPAKTTINRPNDHEIKFGAKVQLNDFIPLIRTRNAVIYVQTKGRESCEVLRGSYRVLRKYNVPFIVMHWGPELAHDQNCEHVLEHFKSIGYTPKFERTYTQTPLESDIRKKGIVVWRLKAAKP